MDQFTVAVNRCTLYNLQPLTELISTQLAAIGVTPEMLSGKKVVVKPNLVMNKKPEMGATTHPVFLTAAVNALKASGADNIMIAESSGGPYTESTIRAHYNGCQITGAANNCDAELNYDPSAVIMKYPEGKICHRFNVIKPVYEADVIIDLCKLKTHSLTKMTCAVKNFFGVIPGIEKFEMHAAYSRQDDFRAMLVDLCEMICNKKTVIAICDGITGMEGNGPTGGTPRDYGVVLSSLSPFCLDLAAEAVLGFEGTVPTVKMSYERGYCPEKADELTIIGDNLLSLRIDDVEKPEASHKSWLTELPDMFGGRVARFFSPHPRINKSKCVGCGECVRSCPKHTISLVESGGKKRALIDPKGCILCYCCQELCPVVAVDIKKNLLVRLAH